MAANTINQLSTANTFQHWLNATELLIATANLLTNGNGEAFYANTRLIVGGSSSNVSLNVQTSATINDLVGNTSNVVTGTFRNLTVTQNVASLNVTGSSYFGQDVVVYGNQQIKGDLEVSGNLRLDALGFDDLSVSGSGSFGNNLTVTGQTTLSNVTVSGNVATLNVTSTAGFGSTVYIAGDLFVGGNITLDTVGFDDLNVSGNAYITEVLYVTGRSEMTGNVTMVNANVTSTLVANNITGAANTRIYDAIAQTEASSLAFAIALG